MEEDNVAIVSRESDKLSATTEPQQILDKLMTEEDPIKIQQITDLFSSVIRKKEVARLKTLSEIQDCAVSEMAERLQNHSDEFNNKDLLDYYKTIQETIDKKVNETPQIKVPDLTQNNVNINITNTFDDRDSRERVIDAVKAILKQAKIQSTRVQQEETSDD